MIKRIAIGRASSPPRGFDQAAYQRRIDEIAGTRDGRPNMLLVWAPSSPRWCPRRMEDDPQGYVFPNFCDGASENGELVAPDRWALLERIEYQQYAPTWELGRYSWFDGSIWDWKGPIPSEKYIELRVIAIHDGKCCPCTGDECQCCTEASHCWGKYVEPNEHLMDWIRHTAWESRNDPDVDPTADIRYFTAPRAGRDLVNAQQRAIEKEDAEIGYFDREMRNVFEKQSATVTVPDIVEGFKKDTSGLFVPE